MTKLQDLDGSLREIVSETAAELFEKRYPNLMAMFSAGDVYSAIASYVRIEGLSDAVKNDFTPQTLCKFTERAFLELLRRNALDQHVKIKFESGLPPEIEHELDQMEISAGIKAAPAKVGPKKEQQDQIADCATDYKQMDTAHFRMKWMDLPARRAIYEQAIAAGRI